jgi:drug/metabolite transporter (DMT)-like permease
MAKASRLNIALGSATIYIIWGSTYLAIRYGVETIPPFMMAGIRFVIGGALFYAWARMQSGLRPTLRQWGVAALVGVLLIVGGNGLVTLAEKTVPSGLTALLVAMVPLWVVLVDWLRPRGTRPPVLAVAGVVLGLAGVAFLINPTNVQGEVQLLGALAVVVASLSWALGSVYSRYADAPQAQSLAAGMQMLAGGVASLVLSFSVGEFSTFEFAAVTTQSLWALAYLTFVGSAAFAVYIWLLRASTPAHVATYAYVNPIIALLLGAALAGEALSTRTLWCSVVILAAVVIIVTAKGRAARASERRATSLPVSELASETIEV